MRTTADVETVYTGSVQPSDTAWLLQADVSFCRPTYAVAVAVGALEVVVKVTDAPARFPCFFGGDLPLTCARLMRSEAR